MNTYRHWVIGFSPIHTLLWCKENQVNRESHARTNELSIKTETGNVLLVASPKTEIVVNWTITIHKWYSIVVTLQRIKNPIGTK